MEQKEQGSSASPEEEQVKKGSEARKESRKERKAAKKRARKERKAARKAEKRAAYQALDKRERIFFQGKRAAAVLILLILVRIGGGLLAGPFDVLRTRALVLYGLSRTVSEEEILAEVPRNEEEAAAVEAMEGYGAQDTWAVYVYMCGSNLEAGNVSDLSAFTSYLIRDEASAYSSQRTEKYRSILTRFMGEIQEQGMDVPDYMYAVNPTVAPVPSAEEEEKAEIGGAATDDITEMLSAQLSENVRIVLQTGGSAAWAANEINPNRSQRFLYDSRGFRQIGDEHIRNMGEADTLADFLSFCKKEYPADHQILIFWDHGAGAFGFASDELYGKDSITLKELRQALERVWQADEEEPPYEIIGFDACLMASVEVAETLHGYGRYLVASEEVEPGFGWNYTPWLEELSASPQMNGAQVGRAIVDAGLEAIAEMSIRYGAVTGNLPSTLSVVDINGAHQVYEAYGELMAAVLKDAVADTGALTMLGRAAEETIKYAQSSYDVYNMVDLGLFVKALTETWPEEAVAVQKSLSNAVIYNRYTAYAAGSTGLSVYFPANVGGANALLYYLDYIYNICEDEAVRTLYYYKIAGCLNEELQEYVREMGYGEAETLDSTALRMLSEAGIELGQDGNFRLQAPEEAASLIQEVSIYLTQVKKNTARILGEDDLISMNETGMLSTEFNGSWIAIDGNFLELELIDSTDSVTRYRTNVLYKREDSWLVLGRNNETGEFSILGVYSVSDESSLGELASRNMQTVSPGDRLRPIYDVYNLEEGTEEKEYGESFTWRSGSEIGYESLDNGEYYLFAVACDVRGDEYYTPVVRLTMRNGEAVSASIQEDMMVYGQN